MPVNVKKLVDYWHREAGYSLDVTKALLEKHKNSECLFFGHLTIEKLLKAIVVAVTKEHAPPIHDLAALLKKTKIKHTQEQYELIKLFNDFYLAGRYDEYKMTFRKKCTNSYTTKQFEDIKKIYLWLKKEAETIYPLK